VNHDRHLAAKLEELGTTEWRGEVFRYTFGDAPPDRENTRGARWNPAGVAAIYTTLERATVLAELRYRLSLDSVRPKVPANLFTIKVTLEAVLDLRDPALFGQLGFHDRVYADDDVSLCQRIGGTVDWLERDGLLVPSARHRQANLVLYPTNFGPAAEFEIVSRELWQPPS
jgi:RES domain-containing protein